MIGVISDSHVPHRAEKIPEKILERLEKADKVVHCGDFETKKVYRNLDERYQDFKGVKGNCDRFQLENSQVFEHETVRFGVYHGTGIHPRGDHETLSKIASQDLDVDVLLNGHTHNEEAVKSGGKILLNPGSCTGVGGGSSSRTYPTFMMVEVSERLRVEIKELDRQKNRFNSKESKTFEINTK